MKLCLILMFGLFMTSSIYGKGVFINELMPSNGSIIKDKDGDYSDWIEIFNSTNYSIDLSDYYLSDKNDDLKKWQFPKIKLPAKEFVLIFASGKNRNHSIDDLHTNFSIKSAGEEVYLSKHGEIIHQVPAISVARDVSIGLNNDGGDWFVFYDKPTPGKSNNSEKGKDIIIFSHQGGIYSEQFNLDIYCLSPNKNVYYSINGSNPTTASYRYHADGLAMDNELIAQSDYFNICTTVPYEFSPPTEKNDKAIVIRAATFDNYGRINSEIVTNTYFIKNMWNYPKELPIISICADSIDLFCEVYGILVPGVYWSEFEPELTGNYYMRGEEWERPMHIEFFEPDGTVGFRQNAGIRTHGRSSRRFPQKGLRLYARSIYGNNSFDYRIFNTKNISRFKRLTLKPFSASWSYAGIEDHLSNQLLSKLNVDAVASRPVVLYINGEYWGIYYIKERIDKYFVADNFDVDADNVDIIDDWFGNVVDGYSDDFNNLYNFIENHDFKSNDNYRALKQKIDVDNFIDYVIFEVFSANIDWPANNMKCWKERTPNSKWRWIFTDGDAAFNDYYFNGYENALSVSNETWPTNAHSTLFFRKLSENDEFVDKFVRRLEFLLNNVLFLNNTLAVFEKSINEISSELPYQIRRFSIPESISNWERSIEQIDYFLNYKDCLIKEQTFDTFGKDFYLASCIKDSLDISEMLIYPNPNSGSFLFSFNSHEPSQGEIVISNLSGKVLHSQAIQIFNGWNFRYFRNLDFCESVYFISVKTPKGNNTTKMITIK